ncbi:2716_t:CDS:1, partial [Scutellospora calospora]
MSEQILYNNWQKAKRDSESVYNKWRNKQNQISKYGGAIPYNLIQQKKAYKKQYDNLKKQERDAEILYLRCKNVSP